MTVENITPEMPMASDASRSAASEIRASSGIRIDAPVRRRFVRSDNAPNSSPMVSIYRGGRGGDVAIRLYVALIWRSARPPFDSAESAAAWATLLDLEDPTGNGARRVRAALKKLSAAKLIRIESDPGRVSRVVLLREDGSGKPYQLPSSSFTAARGDRRDVHRYFKVPTALWTDGQFQSLSGPALVMLMIFLSEQGAEGKAIWFSVSVFQDRYGISPATRSAGTKELRARGLLVETSEKLGGRSGIPNTVFGATIQRRKVYKLTGSARLMKHQVGTH